MGEYTINFFFGGGGVHSAILIGFSYLLVILHCSGTYQPACQMQVAFQPTCEIILWEWKSQISRVNFQEKLSLQQTQALELPSLFLQS